MGRHIASSTPGTPPLAGRTAPSRVLMTADCVGGIWTYAMDLVGALAAHDVEVTLFVSGDVLSTRQMIEAGGLENLTLVRSELKLEWMAHSAADIAEARELLADLETVVRPDVVHVNGFAHAAAGFTAPVVAVAHGCVPTWWRAVRGEAPPAAFASYREGLRAGVAAADCLVAPGAAHLRAFLAENPAPRQSRIIRHGRNPAAYAPGRKEPVVLAAARFWDEAKNAATLTAAARTMQHSVRIAGEGVAPAPGITVLGQLAPADLAREMAAASVFAAPSRYEPFGLSVLEAALSGNALVLADIATFRETWDGVATFVDPDDPRALAAALDGLAGDPARAARAGAAARRRGLALGATAMAAAYAGLYRELAATRPTPSRRSGRGLTA